MTALTALSLIAVLLTATIGVGALLRWREGRPQHHVAHEVIEPHRLGADGLGEVATLLQFSTQMCTKCPGVHRTLSAVADEHSGVRHLDVDLTNRPDIAKHFNVMQTPTTLVLDGTGAVQTRFGGAPSRHVIELELTRITAAPERV